MENNVHPFLASPSNEILALLYGTDEPDFSTQKQRYRTLINSFIDYFHIQNPSLYSTPGRIEIGGNHTDHNHGRVIAASISLDSIAAVTKNEKNTIVLYSEGYAEPFIVELGNLSPIHEEMGKTTALLRGVAACFKDWGYSIGGFNAYISSDVFPGSGLSSSASIEVLIGTILSDLYNNNTLSYIDIAKAGQYAENKYLGKPCGLMDQTACAAGGIVGIDFNEPHNPIIEKITYDFYSHDYHIVVINTGGNHADLTEDYAAIPGEMKHIASLLGRDVCREIKQVDIIDRIHDLRVKAGDRAILRAFHFLAENERVKQQINALKNDNPGEFLHLVSESGNSSWKWLQNIYAPHHPREQGITLALVLTEQFLRKHGKGACRVHGGGFAGTVLAFIPHSVIDEYSILMEKVFGKKAVNILTIRGIGTTRVWP